MQYLGSVLFVETGMLDHDKYFDGKLKIVIQIDIMARLKFFEFV